jgi:hypothetical protein
VVLLVWAGDKAANFSCPRVPVVKNFFSPNHRNFQQNMAKSRFKPTLVSGTSLLAALSSSVTVAVKWLSGPFPYSRDDFGRIPILMVPQAIAIVKAGTYEGTKQKNGRVTHIREIIRPGSEPDFAFWEDRACIRYHDNDGPNSPTNKIKRKLLCDIWDRAVQNPPPRWRPRTLVP